MLYDLKELWQSLTDFHGKFFKIQALIVLSALLENIKIILIVGLIALLSKSESFQNNTYLLYFFDIINIENATLNATKILFLITLFISFFIFLALINAWCLWHRSLFCNQITAMLGYSLYVYYLSQSWLFHTRHNSAKLKHNINNECFRIGGEVINPLMQMTLHFVFVAIMLIWLIALDIMMALLVFSSLAVSYVLISKIFKIRLVSHSKNLSSIAKQRMLAMSEGFGGIKIILLLNCQSVFNHHFREIENQFARSRTITTTLICYPKYFIEVFGFSIIMLSLFYLSHKYDDLTKILPLLGAYAIAGFRLLPVCQQIYENFSMLRNGLVAFNNIKRDLINDSIQKNSNRIREHIQLASIQHSIKLKGIHFSYNKDKTLTNVNINIKVGQVVGLVGHTGSGKSTLIDILLGLIQPDEGCLIVDDTIINTSNIRSWLGKCSAVPQDVFISSASLMENIAFGVPQNEIDKVRIKMLINQVYLDELVDNMAHGMYTLLGERGVQLSGGQKQKISIARALYSQPEVLVLDEATSALDNITENLIMQQINQWGHKKTIVMIAHRLQTVQKCDVIYFMSQGSIIDSGTYDELLQSNADFRKTAFLH